MKKLIVLLGMLALVAGTSGSAMAMYGSITAMSGTLTIGETIDVAVYLSGANAADTTWINANGGMSNMYVRVEINQMKPCRNLWDTWCPGTSCWQKMNYYGNWNAVLWNGGGNQFVPLTVASRTLPERAVITAFMCAGASRDSHRYQMCQSPPSMLRAPAADSDTQLTKAEIEGMGFVDGAHTPTHGHPYASNTHGPHNPAHNHPYASDSHYHDYLTGKGVGHNNTAAVTSVPRP